MAENNTHQTLERDFDSVERCLCRKVTCVRVTETEDLHNYYFKTDGYYFLSERFYEVIALSCIPSPEVFHFLLNRSDYSHYNIGDPDLI